MSRKDARNAAPRAARWKSRLKWIAGGLLIVATGVSIKYIGGNEDASAEPPAVFAKRAASRTTTPEASTSRTAASAASQGAATSKLTTMAFVNGEEIQRQELAQECLQLYGSEVLEGMVNKHLIALYCREQGVTITRQDVEDEIERTARKFKLPKDEWLKMLKQERGISAEQYGEDIIWQTLALRRLAAGKLVASEEEIQKAFDAAYGEAVKARLIVLDDATTAAKIHAEAKSDPDNFGRLANQHSVDVNSASSAGMIQPIRRHMGDPKIEQAAFALKTDEISPIIQVGNQYVILKCDGRIPARAGIDQTSVRDSLAEQIKERKLRSVASEVFEKMQAEAKIENIFNDPAKRKQLPGVAATLNGHKITIQQLADQCIDRHGIAILEGTIHRRLLEQELKRRKLTVTQDDVDAEVARAAVQMGKTTSTGEADVDAWLKMVTEQQGITAEQYIRDAVWPTTALKKLVGDQVLLTNEDIQKGYEANYGPRARCRAIVLPSQRKAQEVWEQARNGISPENFEESVEHFARLAKEYSIEVSSRDLGGQVPPIQRHGGQPTIEAEAFRLQKGELSSIIQAGDKFVVLLSEGFTEPAKIELAEVDEIIQADIHEKKMRIAMAEEFSRLKEGATIENFLAGTTHVPKSASRATAARTVSRPVQPAGHATPIKR